MNYQVHLNTGQIITLNGVTDFNAATFTQTLNDRQIYFVNIGGAIVNKNTIMSIVPVNESAENANEND
ncbi:hypothetical protein [Ureibacillus sp. FSL W8-0352]|uniref:hypothetical protein n=1 Tax=Ureibacillus sp. FSL W8-0352 TaxID=2954596 RepID=UPI0030F8F86E